MAASSSVTSPAVDHLKYLRIALDEARKSPPKPTNFCVGALILVPSTSNEPVVTGYTLECEGNTHAEQCCFIKLAEKYKCSVEELGLHIPEDDDVRLYTTMEPCNKRSVGNTPCVDRILALRRKDGSPAIRCVICGVSEPEKFVGVNEGKKKLQDAGIVVHAAAGLEDEILAVATAGHVKEGA